MAADGAAVGRDRLRRAVYLRHRADELAQRPRGRHRARPEPALGLRLRGSGAPAHVPVSVK